MLVTFESSRMKVWVAALIDRIKYAVIRPLLSFLSYWLFYKRKHKKNVVNFSGQPLKPGIAYCMVAKDEADIIEYCLKSLIGFADQIICIDNGSYDSTFEKMIRFKNENSNHVLIEVFKHADLTLNECRQECLKHVIYSWFLRGDADFIITENLKKIKPHLLSYSRPSAFSCGLLEIFGDKNHHRKFFNPVYQSEYYLRSFVSGIRFHEYYGRLEHAAIPLYYKLRKQNLIGIIHASDNKSNERIFYRTCYLDYREFINQTGRSNIQFDNYQTCWLNHVFGTNDSILQQHRMARLAAMLCEKTIGNSMAEKFLPVDYVSKYQIVYKNNKPYTRILEGASPNENLLNPNSDGQWQPDPAAYYSDSKRKNFLVT